MIDTRCLEDLLAEAQEAIQPLDADIEGLEDYKRLNLRPDTHQEVQALIDEYRRRLGLLITLSCSLADTTNIVNALVADGYPSMPARRVDSEVYEDLNHRVESLLRHRPRWSKRDPALRPGGAPHK